jgi:hypothetical protein
MTASSKLWLARAISIPVLLALPVVCFGIGFVVAAEHRGDSMPIFGLLGFVGGLVLAVLFARMTTFAPKQSSVARCFRIIAGVGTAEAIVWLLLRILDRE